MSDRYELRHLEEGSVVLFAPMTGAQSATVLVMVRTGSRDEPKHLAGISHFLEHMVFKGTEKYRTPLDLSSTIDSFGGEFNAFTSKEFTGFYVKIAVQHMPTAVDVLSQMLTMPLLMDDAIKREKGVVVEEINMYEDHPTRKASVLFDSLIYGKNGLGRETIGSKETVKSFSRTDLLGYLTERYTHERLVVGVAGGGVSTIEEMEKVKEMVGKSFSELPNGEGNGWEKVEWEKQKTARVDVFQKETDQAHFVLGVPSYERGHKDRYVLSVLSTVLGGNMSSRLFTEVREKRGLAYYVKSDLDVFYDAGSFAIHAGVEKSKLEQAIEVIVQQLWEVARGKFEEDEIMRAKEHLKGSLILELEDSQEVADLYVRRFLIEREVITPAELLGKIDEVSEEDVGRVAKDLFKREMLNLVVVGPYDMHEYGQKLMQLLHSI